VEYFRFIAELERWAIVVPAVASLLFLIRLWWQSELFGSRLLLFGAWFLAALGAQAFASGLSTRLAGVGAQTILACVLIIKERIDQTY
jgi:hypothetical protein